MQPFLLPPIAALVILTGIYLARKYSRYQQDRLLREAEFWDFDAAIRSNINQRNRK